MAFFYVRLTDGIERSEGRSRMAVTETGGERHGFESRRF
jgi:hypothetical protein